ncbi:hypothetical protein N7453_007269 [Penicillium expansum]|nr:hypothetical protein N7453_007269 [Penicillium expansum]
MWLGDFGAANAIAGNDEWSSLLPRECDTTQNGPPLFAMAEPVAQYILATSSFCSPIVNGDAVAAAAARMCILRDRISPDPHYVEESFLLM